MRMIANPNIQCLEAVPEEAQAMGGVKIPCLALKCLPSCEYLPFPICYCWHPCAKSYKGGWIEENTHGGRQGF